MAMEIFKLVGSIFVDNKAADESLSKTDKKAEGIGKTLLSGLETAGKWGAAVAGAAVAAGTAIYNTAMDTAEAADEIDKMSQKLGWSREAYQEWDYVLGQAGVDVNSMQTGLKTLTNKLDDAKNGSASATEMFEKLGLSLDDISQMSREDLFSAVIEGFQGMEDSTERAALANDLFGKSGQELTALFNESVESTNELKEAAHELGLVMSDEAIDSGVQLHDTMDTLKRSFSAVGASLGTALIPIVQQFAEFIQANMPMINGLISSLTPVIAQLASTLLPPMMQLVSSVLPMIISLITAIIPPITSIMDAVLPVIISLLETLLPPFIQIVEAILPPLLTLIEPLLQLLDPIIQLLNPILSLVTSLITPLAQLLTSVIGPLTKIISGLIEVALIPLQAAFSVVSGTLTTVFGAAISFVTGTFETLKNVFTGIIDFLKNVFTGNWSAAWESIKGIVTSIWDGIVSGVKGGINWVITGINNFINGINAIKIPSWVPLVGGKSFNIATIPLLEEGGVLEKGQTGFLEGNGAEAVVPLENNRKWINAVAEDMQNAVGGEQVTALLTDILEALENIAGAGVYINGDKLVGAIAPSMNQQLGRMAAREARA